jgi:hypothetical protein
MRRYKLSHTSASRLGRLLHLEYTPTDLARELDCSQRKILTAIEGGCPHRRTKSGRFRIVGDAFAAWYQEIIHRRKRPLGFGEAFCLSCQRAIPLPPEDQCQHHPLPHGNERVEARCPICGKTVNRIRNAEVAL